MQRVRPLPARLTVAVDETDLELCHAQAREVQPDVGFLLVAGDVPACVSVREPVTIDAVDKQVRGATVG